MRAILVAGMVGLLSGCVGLGGHETAPQHSLSASSRAALRKFKGVQVYVDAFQGKSKYTGKCRSHGTVSLPQSGAMTRYLRTAFNNELKMANLYHWGAATSISGRIVQAKFDSTPNSSGDGYWKFIIILTSSDGNSLQESYDYRFKAASSTFAHCAPPRDALKPAVRGLVNKTVTDPQFASLLAPQAGVGS